jgi:2TM domain-containing protein
MATDIREQTPRDRAMQQLKKRRDFRGHVLIYVLVNAFLVAIWAITNPHGFFWPLFIIGGWGIAVVMNAWDVYWRRDITEEEVRHEMEREAGPN